MAGFKYRARTPEQWEKHATQQSSFPGIFDQDYKEYVARKGENWIRILPPTWDEFNGKPVDHYGLEIFVHYSVGPGRQTIICPFKMNRGPCPICEAKARADRANDKELSDSLRWARRVVVWILDLKEPANGPQIWSMPSSLDVTFCKLARDPRTGDLYVLDHPTEGYGISFEKIGELLTTKYVATQVDRKPSAVSKDVLEFIELAPIPDVLVFSDYATIDALYKGAAGGGRETQEGKPQTEETTHKPAQPGPGLRPRGAAASKPTPSEPEASMEDDSLQKDSEALHQDEFKQEEPLKSAAPSSSSATLSLKEKIAALKAKRG